ncbi:MAG: hypothetical protein KGH99_04830 [Thaumarchaeota archaeon]|nr:hypothetical protein [Candidatus Nitrosotalea sp.]MDE1872788.1 hypothetical protein [Nitrososphaerota archaeon]
MRITTLLNPINDDPNGLKWDDISNEFNSKWHVGDTVNIKLLVSTSMDNKTATWSDLGNSTIVP